MALYQAKNIMLSGAVAPDEYDDSFGRIPPNDFVVSRNKDGSALSTYGQIKWDRTPYEPNGKICNFNFKFWVDGELTQQRSELVEEIKWLMFIMIYLRYGRALSNTSYKFYLYSIHVIARLCDSRSIKIQDFLADPRLLIESATEFEAWAYCWSRLIQNLKKLGLNAVGFDVSNNDVVQKLNAIARAYDARTKQHPPIPTFIYSSILSALAQDLQEFELVADRIIGLLNECTSDFLAGRKAKSQWKKRRAVNQEYDGMRPTFSKLLNKYNLEDYWLEKGYIKSVWGLSTAITNMLVTANLQIQAYTGMRTSEVQSLPYYCLEEVERNGSIHYIVKGRITKLTHGLIKRTQWVTSTSGRRAILLVQRFSEAVYKSCGEIPKNIDTRINSFFLFISPSYALFDKWNHAPAELELSSYTKIKMRYQPIIDEESLLELEQIDPHRAWRTEEIFQCGNPWPLTTHQLRRSLALYAQRSGIVTLPTLKRQLQQITAEMATYYGRGSEFAKNFINDDKKHFGREWQDSQPLSQFLSYAANVVLTDEVLFGAHPHWIEMRMQGDNEGIVLFDRSETLKRFKKGEMAYRETLIGGCINTMECDTNPLDIYHTECLVKYCKNLVGHKRKLEVCIAAQSRHVEKLMQIDSKSPDCRHEVQVLSILRDTLEGVLKNTGASEETTDDR